MNIPDEWVAEALRASDAANEGGVVGGREKMMRAALEATMPRVAAQVLEELKITAPIDKDAEFIAYAREDVERLPTEPLSVIYNVTATNLAGLFPVGLLVTDGVWTHGVWTLLDKEGETYYCNPRDIESFDPTPPKEER